MIEQLSDLEIIDRLCFNVDVIQFMQVHREPPSVPFACLSMIRWQQEGLAGRKQAYEINESITDYVAQYTNNFATLFRLTGQFVLTEQPLEWNRLMAKLALDLNISQTVPFDPNARIREELPGGLIVLDPKVILFMGEGTTGA